MKDFIRYNWGFVMFIFSCIVVFIVSFQHPLVSLCLIPFWVIFGVLEDAANDN
jgi:hypothetical protein